ncbi:Hypothetical protein KNT65_gp044 [Escherichia phage EcS1]|uniref:Lipoprotein n=1 Tax=Escherichia phage EcS1 TaxID=2083276 RepID=A0A2Z5ZCH1_9CAUD|nr:Hypothetical protein KNT65_gp044 [Escherichia phage EcS1]BBC78092.1 Hypothetical protein [Escherichia phage EcS1]
MKLLIIALSLSLVGCAGTNINQPYDGNLKFKGGTGLIYERVSNQCGGNCDKYANMKVERVEFPGEREALLRTTNAEKRSALARKCQQIIDVKLSKIEYNYSVALESGDYKAAELHKNTYVNAASNYYSTVNKCVEENI